MAKPLRAAKPRWQTKRHLLWTARFELVNLPMTKHDHQVCVWPSHRLCMVIILPGKAPRLLPSY